MSEFKDVFPRGEENTAYSKYFVGQSYLNMLSVEQVVIGNVTFEPGCRNNWHIIMRNPAVDRFCFAQPVEDIIRNGGKNQEN